MITQKEFTEPALSYDLTTRWPLPELAIFDIETTGFSPKTASVYLIGVLFWRENRWQMIQWMAENLTEEADLLNAFSDFVKEFRYLIHFNGDSFDLPFLKARSESLSLPFTLSHCESIDLYRCFRPLKKFLKLSAANLKSFERFLSIEREDTLDGGKLISVYHQFCKERKEPQKSLLLLHNHDDLMGTLALVPLFSYLDFLEGAFSLDILPETEPMENGFSLTYQLSLSHPVPVRISYRFEQGYLTMQEESCRLMIHGIKDSLRYFFPDYKNYYYLPLEDTAIHKSVAFYVDKEHRIPAKASTCYCRKSGLFLPGNDAISAAHFKQDYRDRDFFIECSEDFLSDSALQKSYLLTFFRTFSNNECS